MKISELIERLEELKKEHGDKNVYYQESSCWFPVIPMVVELYEESEDVSGKRITNFIGIGD